MVAAALPIAIAFGLIAELASGLTGRLLGGEKGWWRGVSAVRSDVLALFGDRSGNQRVAAVEAGAAAAALLGAGLAAAGALGLAPDDLPLIYLSLAAASVGALIVSSVQTTPTGHAAAGRIRRLAALAEPASAVGLGVMFLRYAAVDLEAVRGTQQVLGTGAVLGPVVALAGLLLGAVAFLCAAALRLPEVPEPGVRARGLRAGAGTALLLRLCRWAIAGAASLLAAVLLAGGSLDPASTFLPVGVGALVSAVVIGATTALFAKLPDRWRTAVPLIALLAAAIAAAMVVLA